MLLATAPTTLPRLIARRQRITLPPGGGTAPSPPAPAPRRPRPPRDTGFFPLLPPPSAGSPLVRVWLVDDPR